MDAKEYIVRQVRWMRRQVDATMQDITPEQYNWVPPGAANPISTIYLHLIGNEDGYFQQVILGKPRIWETQGWESRIGSNAPTPGQGWDQAKTATQVYEAVLEYQKAVYAATDTYIESLTPEELDRRVNFLGGERRVADVLASFVVHTLGHAGEIAALRGVQGVKGLPF